MNSMVEKIAKPLSYHWLVLTLSAIDWEMPPKMVYFGRLHGTKEGHGEETVHDVLVIFVKNEEGGSVARSCVTYTLCR